MPHILTKLRIDEVSSVDKGAGEGVKIVLMKRDNSDDNPSYLFNDIMLRKADVSDTLRGPRNEPDDKKLSVKLEELVAEMIVAAPSLHPQRARRWLLHTPQGRELLAQHKKETPMSQVDIMKLISTVEDGLMAQVTKRDGESYAKSFTRKYENDIEFRKQWRDLTEAKHQALGKGMASLKPTSTEVGNTLVADDSAEAVRLLNEMATKQGRKFEDVMADPANSKLAARTYTAAHRSSVNTDYLQE